MKLWEAGKGRPAASCVGPRAAFARWSTDVVWAVLLERTLGSHLCPAVRCEIGARRDWGPPWSRFPEPLPPVSLASEEARAPASWLPRPEQPPLLRTLGTSDLPERWGDGLFARLPDARRPWERQGDLCASHLCTAAQLAGGAAPLRRGPGRPDSSGRTATPASRFCPVQEPAVPGERCPGRLRERLSRTLWVRELSPPQAPRPSPLALRPSPPCSWPWGLWGPLIAREAARLCPVADPPRSLGRCARPPPGLSFLPFHRGQ